MDMLVTGCKTISEIGIETRMLYDALKDVVVGGTVTYSALSEIAGRDVRGDGYGSLTTARRMCQREHQMVFSAVRGVGLRRLDDGQIVDATDGDILRIRRAAKRGVERLACADYKGLPDEKKPMFNAKAAILGTLAQHSGLSQVKQIERHYANSNAPLLPKELK